MTDILQFQTPGAGWRDADPRWLRKVDVRPTRIIVVTGLVEVQAAKLDGQLVRGETLWRYGGHEYQTLASAVEPLLGTLTIYAVATKRAESIRPVVDAWVDRRAGRAER